MICISAASTGLAIFRSLLKTISLRIANGDVTSWKITRESGFVHPSVVLPSEEQVAGQCGHAVQGRWPKQSIVHAHRRPSPADTNAGVALNSTGQQDPAAAFQCRLEGQPVVVLSSRKNMRKRRRDAGLFRPSLITVKTLHACSRRIAMYMFWIKIM